MTKTTRRWAWKQPSFEERVLAHWSSFFAPKMYRGSREPPNWHISLDNDDMVAERSVKCRSLSGNLGGAIRSENADMSNDKSCEKHDRRKSKGFCAPDIDAEWIGPLEDSHMSCFDGIFLMRRRLEEGIWSIGSPLSFFSFQEKP